MSDSREDGAGGRRPWRIAGRAGAMLVGAVASAELLASAPGARHPAGPIAAAVALTVVPAIALAAAIWRWSSGASAFSFATWMAAGAAVLVATSVPPLAHVEGMQTGGLAAVATMLLVVPVIRGGYKPRGVADVRALGPMVGRIDSDR